MEKLAIDGGTPVHTTGFAGWPIYDDLEKQLLMEVLESGKWGGAASGGPGYKRKLAQFEEQFAQSHDAQYGVTVVNGTVAITVALQAAGVQSGDEVIMPPYTFIATATAALAFGAIPVFVDIEEDTLLIDPDKIEQAITPRTKAIIAVHIAGTPANMTKLKDIAAKHNLALIEDAAQAVGAIWDGQHVGAIGDLGTFSFQSSKNLNAGEGGMITTNNAQLWERAWSICNVGRSPLGEWYQHDRIGQNYRMTEFQAAILLAQITRLEQQMQCREQNVARLNQSLGSIQGLKLLRKDARVTRQANHLYMFKLDMDTLGAIDKADFIRKVNAEGIPISSGYVPLNQNEAIIEDTARWTGNRKIYACPITERMCEHEVLWLHQHVLLSGEQDIANIGIALQKVLRSYE